ncbi:MAG: hypothetical protein PHW92_11630 [Lutibacter sp.]|nr:hypothetical protein [Lutibacter sp.]
MKYVKSFKNNVDPTDEELMLAAVAFAAAGMGFSEINSRPLV